MCCGRLLFYGLSVTLGAKRLVDLAFEASVVSANNSKQQGKEIEEEELGTKEEDLHSAHRGRFR